MVEIIRITFLNVSAGSECLICKSLWLPSIIYVIYVASHSILTAFQMPKKDCPSFHWCLLRVRLEERGVSVTAQECKKYYEATIWILAVLKSLWG